MTSFSPGHSFAGAFLRRCVARFALALLAFCPAVANANGVPAAGSDPRAAEFDALFRRLVEEQEIPGLAAVLVHGDTVLLSSGYGLADLTHRRPVDPERTIFPLGSISKLLTTVAVLQLAEKGALDLEADIDRYLGPGRVDRRFAEPVRVRHLLTHTDGLDARWLIGGAARVPEKVQPLERLLATLPPRTMPPGEIYLYSDVGMTVAGLIVQRVSGEAFADYMARRVFAPLGMRRATFRIDVGFDARDRATGYDYDETGTLRPAPVVYPHAAPASGLMAPVGDLGPLMIALLRSAAAPDSPHLLGDGWVRELWRRQFSHHPAIPGTAYGLYEYFHRGRRALVHGGLLPGFTTVIALVPDAGVGLCVAANRFAVIEQLENDLLRELLDRFAPGPTAASIASSPARPAAPQTAPSQLAGLYRCDQYSRFSADKLFLLAGAGTDLLVEEAPGGGLRLQPEGTAWREIAPLLFENPETGDRIAFHTDDRGRGTRLVGSAQLMSYHRVGLADDIGLNAIAMLMLGLLSCVGLVFAPRVLSRPAMRWTHALRLTALALALGWLAFFAGGALVVRELDFVATAFGEPRSIALLRLLPLGCAVAGIALLFLALCAWRARAVSRGEACGHALAALAALLLVPVLAHWQLVRLPVSSFFSL